MSKSFLGKNLYIPHEKISVILLALATVSALLIRNSTWGVAYLSCLHASLLPNQWSGWLAPITCSHIVNEGLIVAFFALVSLEIKKELVASRLKNNQNLLLPCIAAVGGVVVPILVYLLFNFPYVHVRHGWAIPTATDVVFPLGLLSILGDRVPTSMKLFLSSLAIVDDICGIVIIGIAYTQSFQWTWFVLSVWLVIGLWVLNQMTVSKLMPYGILGACLWLTFLKTGIHPSLAGVLWAFAIPLETSHSTETISLGYQVESYLYPMVNYIILPLFAFVNAGVSLVELHFSVFQSSVFMGVFLGLAVGKPLGIFLATEIAVATGIANLPTDMDRQHLLSVSCLGGIGFTMSFFISELAFTEASLLTLTHQAILIASVCSAIFALLFFPKTTAADSLHLL